MKTIHISDNPNNIIATNCICNTPDNLIQEIIEKYFDSDIFIININFDYNNIKRSDNAGIKLLKLLRLKGYNQYCILYSFLSAEQLIHIDPLNSIVHSKGAKFIRLPYNLSNLEPLLNSKKSAEKENLIYFFRAEVDLHKVRHELANKWGALRLNELLDINTETNPNYYVQILKYLSPFSLLEDVDKTRLNNMIRNFDVCDKKILYYDDMSELWQPGLEKLFGKENILCLNPKTTSQKQLFNIIYKENIGCLLLDLRLENEKDFRNVLDYSGGKLLLELKSKFSTLPVVIFTASNKAESLRQLLAAGAEYVWTKEGVDDGINNQLTLNNTLNLIAEVSKCMKKFKNSTYERIFKNDCLLSKTGNKKLYLNQFNENNYTKIYLDTNYLINSIKYNYISDLYRFLKFSKYNKNIVVVIHADVIEEIFVISRQYENKDNGKDLQFTVPVCKYLLEKLCVWRDMKLYTEEYQEGFRDSIKLLSDKSSINNINQLDKIEQINMKKTKFLDRIFSHLNFSKQLQIQEINKHIEKFNEVIDKTNFELNQIPDFRNLRLHADFTFATLIPENLEKNAVFLITDDKKCASGVDNAIESKGRQYPHELKILTSADFNTLIK